MLYISLHVILSASKRNFKLSVPHVHTMAGFEDSCPKTQAWNLAPVVTILFQSQKFQNLVNDPQFFESWKQEFLEKEWKWSHKSKNSCPSFGTEFPKTGHSGPGLLVSYLAESAIVFFLQLWPLLFCKPLIKINVYYLIWKLCLMSVWS